MTRKELLQIPGLGALIQSLDEFPAPAGSLIPPRPQCTARSSEPGDVWRVIENTQQMEEHDYSPTNPHCSTVVILKREDELAGGYAVYRVAPVFADIRYCGVQDAIFPREVFGYEAAVACGCEFTLTSKELERCEGSLPPHWLDQLADFAAWMESEDGEEESAFPPGLKTGRPFTHPDDPGYIFHANLAANLQPLMATVLEELCPDEEHFPDELPSSGPSQKQGAKSEDQVTPTEEKEIEDFLYAITYLRDLEELEESEEFALAADSAHTAVAPKSLSFEALFFVTRHGVFISARPAGQDIAFLVLDERGERSTVLDGANILGADGRALATISDAGAVAPRDALTAGFRLIDCEGNAVHLEPTSRDDSAT